MFNSTVNCTIPVGSDLRRQSYLTAQVCKTQVLLSRNASAGSGQNRGLINVQTNMMQDH